MKEECNRNTYAQIRRKLIDKYIALNVAVEEEYNMRYTEFGEISNNTRKNY